MIYGRVPRMLASYEKGMAQNEEVEEELKNRDEVISTAKKAPAKAQERMKK